MSDQILTAEQQKRLFQIFQHVAAEVGAQRTYMHPLAIKQEGFDVTVETNSIQVEKSTKANEGFKKIKISQIEGVLTFSTTQAGPSRNHPDFEKEIIYNDNNPLTQETAIDLCEKFATAIEDITGYSKDEILDLITGKTLESETIATAVAVPDRHSSGYVPSIDYSAPEDIERLGKLIASL